VEGTEDDGIGKTCSYMLASEPKPPLPKHGLIPVAEPEAFRSLDNLHYSTYI
jgi:hypothetical protein